MLKLYIHNTAKRKGIDNTPNPTQLENMKITAEKVFEPLRSLGWWTNKSKFIF